MKKKRKRKFKTYYIHTIDNAPARFDGDTIVDGGNSVPVVTTLARLRREQRSAVRYDSGWNIHGVDYGYIRVRVPCGEVE